MFQYRCRSCGKMHQGLPDLACSAPLYHELIPEHERAVRAPLSSDFCIVDGEHFFVRGVLQVPILSSTECFGWGVWVSLSKKNFLRYEELFHLEPPEDEGPWFGWLSNRLPHYPDTLSLRTRVHLQPAGQRPLIELQEADHPLVRHQQKGMALDDLLEFVGPYLDCQAGRAD